jgi:hypothetical protein
MADGTGREDAVAVAVFVMQVRLWIYVGTVCFALV